MSLRVQSSLSDRGHQLRIAVIRREDRFVPRESKPVHTPCVEQTTSCDGTRGSKTYIQLIMVTFLADLPEDNVIISVCLIMVMSVRTLEPYCSAGTTECATETGLNGATGYEMWTGTGCAQSTCQVTPAALQAFDTRTAGKERWGLLPGVRI